MNRYLTSADRALIARITDLTVDLTAQGRYVADAFYLGNGNSFTLSVKRRRTVTDAEMIASTFSLAIALPSGPEPADFIRERTQTLAQMTRFLESLLEVPGARS